MNDTVSNRLPASLDRFVTWLDRYGETSYDHQTFFAGPLGKRAKRAYYTRPVLGKLVVAPMVFCEAFLPSARRFFWRRQRLPISDAHYAMGFAYLFHVSRKEEHYDRAVHFLRVLRETRCPKFENLCWGYPFDWQTRNGLLPANMPLITTTPYAYEAFSDVYDIDNDSSWLTAMRSIAEHALRDIPTFEVSEDADSAGYTPYDRAGGVVNASAYRAFLLTAAAQRFEKEEYWQAARRNINFVLKNQQEDGSWPYAVDSQRGFVDHFHTCFVLKALAKITRIRPDERCQTAIRRGATYYLANLFDENGLPKPFSRRPRLTVYVSELYDYAECINLGVLLRSFDDVSERLDLVVNDLLERWQKRDGSFRSRKLFLGWDNVPMHRWGQSQAFRSLSLLLRDSVSCG